MSWLSLYFSVSFVRVVHVNSNKSSKCRCMLCLLYSCCCKYLWMNDSVMMNNNTPTTTWFWSLLCSSLLGLFLILRSRWLRHVRSAPFSLLTVRFFQSMAVIYASLFAVFPMTWFLLHTFDTHSHTNIINEHGYIYIYIYMITNPHVLHYYLPVLLFSEKNPIIIILIN